MMSFPPLPLFWSMCAVARPLPAFLATSPAVTPPTLCCCARLCVRCFPIFALEFFLFHPGPVFLWWWWGECDF